jgi:hypothetical protein
LVLQMIPRVEPLAVDSEQDTPPAEETERLNPRHRRRLIIAMAVLLMLAGVGTIAGSYFYDSVRDEVAQPAGTRGDDLSRPGRPGTAQIR